MIQKRRGLRQWGLEIFSLPPGTQNAITDVKGVAVGHCTIIKGDAVRTGVTAILPHQGNIFKDKVPAAVEVINGFGKAAGLTQINELGELETPIILTNTLSVGLALDALVEYKLKRNPEIGLTGPAVNGVVAECNDGYLNDIRGRHVQKEHAWEAIASASCEPPAEGSVGAGTGMKSFGCKSGIGTSSRHVEGYLLGVLVLSNFGKWEQLKIAGVPVGRLLEKPGVAGESNEKGSIIIVLATDAPLDSRRLKRVARRAGFGLARTGSVGGHYSGDFVIAFSTGVKYSQAGGGRRGVSFLRDDKLDPLFEAAAEATEEAIINALLAAGPMTGRDGHSVPALPVKEIVDLLSRRRL